MAKTKQKLTRILSIDGGGIRGIIPGKDPLRPKFIAEEVVNLYLERATCH